MSPLYKLLKKDYKCNWTDDCEKDFQTIKEKLISSEVLMTYDPNLPIKITTDASLHGVAAMLSHIVDGNHKRQIAYSSRTLMNAEKGYSQLD